MAKNMVARHGLNLIAILCIMTSLVSCSSPTRATVDSRGYFEQADPVPPEGVVQYCWEEPLVNTETVNAGVDSRGNWYIPAHTSINEVKMGRWRPCREMRSKAYGEDELIPLD